MVLCRLQECCKEFEMRAWPGSNTGVGLGEVCVARPLNAHSLAWHKNWHGQVGGRRLQPILAGRRTACAVSAVAANKPCASTTVLL